MENIIDTIEATSVNDKEIILKNEEDLMRVYALVKDNTNFVFKWVEGSMELSKLVIASNLLSKIENGDISLSSKREIKKEAK